jgi:ribosomal protein S18 acetylase RimI-like enzyme
VKIRDARPDEFDQLGDVRLAAYRADGFLSPQSTYASTLRALGADGLGHVLVAVDGELAGSPAAASSEGPPQGSGHERILGTVMLQSWPHSGESVAGPEEAEIRALAVVPEARGMGLGRILLTAAITRAAAVGVPRLVLMTQPGMAAAQHIYETAGFARVPGRDWSPEPGVTLLAYALTIAG